MCFGQRKSKMSKYWIMLSAILFAQSQFDRESVEIREKEMFVFQILRKAPCFQSCNFKVLGRDHDNSQIRSWFITLLAFSTLSKSAIYDRVRSAIPYWEAFCKSFPPTTRKMLEIGPPHFAHFLARLRKYDFHSLIHTENCWCKYSPWSRVMQKMGSKYFWKVPVWHFFFKTLYLTKLREKSVTAICNVSAWH